MTQPAADPEQARAIKKSRVAAWAMWDCGFVGMYAIAGQLLSDGAIELVSLDIDLGSSW